MMKKFFSLLVVALVATVMMAETASVTFSAAGYENAEELVAERLGDVVVAFDKGTGSTTPKYYTSGTAARCYAKNTMTFASETATITQIKLTYGSSDGTNAITADKGTFANDTWTGSETSVVLTVGGTNGHRRIAAIEVTYTPAAPLTTLYFVNAKGWGTPHVRYYAEGANTSTEGTITYTNEMVDGFKLYSTAIPAGAVRVSFDNGGSAKSDTMAIGSKAYFNYGDNTWYASASAIVMHWFFKHPFNGSTWEWREATRDGEGAQTFSLRAIYRGGGCNWNGMANDKYNTWKDNPTLAGGVAAGDSAVFTLNPYSKTITITKIELPAFDGTVTTNPATISSKADLEGIQLTFVNATSVALMDEDDMGGIFLGSSNGSSSYAIWHPSLGGACTIAGNVVTLTGWLTSGEGIDELPTESGTLYMEDYGNFVVDGEDLDEFETIEISYTASGAGPGPEPIATITAGKYYVTTFLADSNIVATSLAADKTYGYLPIVRWTGYTEDMTAAEEYEFVAVAGEHAHFYIKMGDGRYLYQTGNYNSYNVTNDTATVGAKWEVEIMGNYHKITNVEKQKVVQFDEQYHTFGCYPTITRTLPTLVAVPSVSTSVENAKAEEAVKAVKLIENGQLIIEKNGVRYSALGVKL